MKKCRRFGVGVLAALAVLIVGAATSGAAGSPSIVISQVYGGGGNSGAVYQNDFVELFNRGATPVSVAGWSVQYASATGTGNFAPTVLSGSISPGQHYLVRLATNGAVGAVLPAPDATGSTNMGGTAGKVIVANVATSIGCNGASNPCSAAQTAQIVDLVGYGNANYSEGAAAPTLTNGTAGLRRANGCQDTDNNASDFTAETPVPRNTASPLTPCETTTNPSGVGSADPSSVQRGGSTLLSVAVTPGSGPTSTGLSVTGDLSAIGGSPATSFVDAGNNTFTFQAAVPTATPPGTKTLPVTIADAQGRTGAASIALTVTDAFICGEPATKIDEIQGAGLTANGQGETRTIEGVVVGDYQQFGGFGGVYVEEESSDWDDDGLTSEGIFVFTSRAASVGDVVRVRGTVTEFSGLTELTAVSALQVCGAGSVPAVGVSLPVDAITDLERFEGMRVRFDQTLTATEVFNLGRFGEVSLSGVGRLWTPTAVVAPGADAIAYEAQNQRSRIVLDDGDNRQNIDPTVYPFGGLSALNTLRVGDTLNGLDGIMDYRFGVYRIQPVGIVAFESTNPRTDAPEDVGGNVKIASFNVLNYFNGPDFPTARGANTPFELQRQTAKEVAALKAMDADIVGLMETENDADPDSAISTLVGALNDATAPATYAYINTGVIGTDQIKVALMYKPAAVTPVGTWKIITSAVDPEFIDTKSRPSLAQTFMSNATGARFTVVVNHLKSKSSDCNDVGDPDVGDGQGNCNQTRTKAARALVRWLQTDPTGSGDPDFLLIGDMNSYAMEDPITAFKAGGLHDLVAELGAPGAYSYVFNGEAGYLDHAISTDSLRSQVTGVGYWHINPDEPSALDYNTEFKTANQVNTFYAPTPYRSSDHDPVLIGLEPTISVAQACTLVSTYVTKNKGLANSLCVKLQNGAYEAFRNEVSAQTDKAITAAQAATLLGAVGALAGS